MIRYTAEHFWVRLEDGGTAVAGLTRHAQDTLGDIVVVDVQASGRQAENTVVGVVEVIPILGFWIASIAIVLAGWSVSPATAAWAFLAYLTLNQLVGWLVTPRVMGRHLRMHPFIVTVSILSGGVLLGAAGAILALPLAAALQSLISEFAPRSRRAGR